MKKLFKTFLIAALFAALQIFSASAANAGAMVLVSQGENLNPTPGNTKLALYYAYDLSNSIGEVGCSLDQFGTGLHWIILKDKQGREIGRFEAWVPGTISFHGNPDFTQVGNPFLVPLQFGLNAFPEELSDVPAGDDKLLMVAGNFHEGGNMNFGDPNNPDDTKVEIRNATGIFKTLFNIHVVNLNI